MTPRPSQQANYYALLIGINAYDKFPLRGSVNDVNKLKQVLEARLGDKISIRLLTATERQRGHCCDAGQTAIAATAPAVTREIVEDSASRPTFRNVLDALNKLKNDALTGDYVYFHYSGHGHREAPNVDVDDMATNRFSGDLSLCLLGDDSDPWKVSLMNGQTLAGLFSSIVDKGIILTATLDCCFSATVYRAGGDETIRCLQQGQALRSASSTCDGGGSGSDGIVYRNLSMSPNWLMDASKYAILTASGPHESAFELKDNGEYFGKLSYFLHSILESRDSLRMRHASIHRHLRGMFFEDAQWNTPQFPCLFGNKKQAFLGPPLQPDTEADGVEIPIVSTSNGLILLAGAAHGLRKDDQVTVRTVAADTSTESTTLSVLEPRGVTSILGGDHPPNRQLGPFAILRTQSRLGDFPISLDASLGELDKWQSALAHFSLKPVHLATDSKKPVFGVRRHVPNQAEGMGVFQITDSETGKELKYLPPMPEDRTSVEDVVAVLHHMAKYKLVEELSNSMLGGNSDDGDSFLKSFSVTVTTGQSQHAYSEGQQVEIWTNAQDDSSHNIKVCIENAGSTDLYAYIYALSPLWEIEHVHHATLAVVTAKQNQHQQEGCERTLQYTLEPHIPSMMMNDSKVTHYDDILKVIVTSHETAFDILEQQNVWSIRDWTSEHRTGGGPSRWSGPEKWAAFNFPVRTWV